jgi:TonB-linked SusC/RagA family outer membrane protein
VELGTKIWGYNGTRELNDFDGSSSYMSRAVPCIYPYYDGKYGWMENSEQSSNSRNNLYFINRLNGKETNTYMNASVFANVYLPYDFKYHASFNYSRNDTEYKKATKTLNAYSFRTNDWAYYYSDLSKLTLTETPTFAYRWTFETDLSWNHTYGKHDLSALVGFESQYYNYHKLSAAKTGFITDALTEMDVVTTMKDISGTQYDYASASVFGRINYAYDNRYLFEANMRYDGSSRFARQSRWGLFPSVSAGWRLSQEKFMEDASTWLSNLKIRASWGKLGNNSIGNYEYLSTYSTGYGYVFGNTQSSGSVATLSNSLLEWESTTSTDVGLDLGVLNNRLTFEADYYHRLTDGILYKAPISLTAGMKTPPYQNLCGVTNNGYELTARWNDRIDKVSYGISVNFTRNYGKVSKYSGELEAGWVTDENGFRSYKTNIGSVSTVVDPARRVIEGRLINEFYLLNLYKGDGSYYFADGTVNPNGGPRDGMIRTEQDLNWVKDMIAKGNTFLPNKTVSKSTIWYGDYLYADVNGDGVYGDDNDYTFQNVSMTPKYYYGLQANLSWKGFDFSMQWAGAGGFSIYWRYLGYNCSSTRADTSIPLDIANDHYYYDPENPTDPRTNISSKNPRLTYNYGSEQNRSYSTLWLYKGDYLKLKNVTIGYKLPTSLLRKASLQEVRLFVSGDNLLCITDFPGMDPEYNSTTNYYASLRQYSFGLNVKF